MYKYYLPNLMRPHSYVNSDQVPYLDFYHITKKYKPKPIPERKKKKTKEKKKNITTIKIYFYLSLFKSRI